LYMDALKACSEWLDTATERLEAASVGDTESDTDILVDKLSSLRVSTIAVPAL